MDIKLAAQEFYNYSLHIKNFSKNTVRRYRYAIDTFCAIKQIINLKEVNEIVIRDLLFYGRTQRNWSSNTVMVFHKSLMVFFEWCIKQKYIESNPMKEIDRPVIEQKLPLKLTKQQTLRLIEIVDNYPYNNSFLRFRNTAIFATFVYAGLRKNELLCLKFTDIDLENRTIFIRQGKGRKDRIVPITTALASYLIKYIEERKKRKKTVPEFFVSLQFNKPFTTNGLNHLISMLRPITGIRFSAHKLRHTFATLMLEGGCDIYSLSKMMGHSDIKTTTIYLSASAEHLRLQISKHPMN